MIYIFHQNACDHSSCSSSDERNRMNNTNGNRRKRPNKLSWFSYNQSQDFVGDELSLHPLKLENVSESPSAEENLSPVSETFWLSPTIEEEKEFVPQNRITEGGGGGGRKSGARKGQFAKSKGHHGRGGQNENQEHLNMDPEYRTHMLFPGARGNEDGETLMGGRASGSPSFMKSVFGAGWGRRGTQVVGAGQPALDPRFQISPEQLDPYLRGAKQVSFINENGSEQRRANSYADQTRTTPGPQGQPATNGSMPGNSSAPAGNTGTANRKPSCDPTTMNGNGPPRLRPPPSGPGQGQRAPSIDTMNRPPGGAPPRTSRTSRTTPMMSPEEMAARGREVEKMQVQQSFQRDCFIIPQESVERFLPDGITLPRQPSSQLINVLEVDDPKVNIVFHMMAPLESLTPHLDSPLADHNVLLRKLAKDDLERCKELHVNEGFTLKNLEANSEYPFINYFVIHKTRDEAAAVFTHARAATYDAFSPENTGGLSCGHTYDKYDEVATIARPPIEPISRKPTADTTGYIVCMYRVFKGDDGQKFERNWLYWTGARMLYKNLPRAVGLRRITLHKTMNLKQEMVYFLLVECSHFMDHINEAANLLPILRARICGYTGIFRCVESF